MKFGFAADISGGIGNVEYVREAAEKFIACLGVDVIVRFI